MYASERISSHQGASPNLFNEPFPLLFDVVAIAGSAGGIPALQALFAVLPANFPVPIVVVQHLSASSRFESRLPTVLQYCTSLKVKWAEADEALEQKTVYVAPQDAHLVVGPEKRFRLCVLNKVNHSRPSADALFQSIALQFGERAIGIVLSGAGSDGANGAAWMKQMGGRIIVQDRLTAQHFEMPGATAAMGNIDFILPLRKIADFLIALVMVKGAGELLRVKSRSQVML